MALQKLVTDASDNGMGPVWHHAIIWTNADLNDWILRI